jgi:hypothetical protein
MKKHILSFVLFGFCIVLSCRSKEIAAVIIPQDLILKSDDYLKSVSVTGATDVKIDYDLGIIQVTLPESYSSKSISLDFILDKTASISYFDTQGKQKLISNTNNPEKISLDFSFEGSKPLNIQVTEKYPMGKNYIVYVNHTNGQLQAQLERVDSVSYSLVTDFYLDIFSSLGTVPNKHNGKLPYLLLKRIGSINADTAITYKSNDNFFGGFKLDKYAPFENELFKIELVVNDKNIVLFENFKFLRKKAVIEDNYGGLGATIGKIIDLKGGVFVVSNKYIIKLSNDYTNGNIELKTQVKDATTLSVETNQIVKSGGYLIDIYENEIIIYHGVINTGNGGLTSAIRNFIKYDNSPLAITPPARSSTKKEQFTAGDSLLILSSDAVFFGNSRPITPEELESKIAPKLHLKMSSKEIILNPIKKVYGWAIAGASVLYFQYTIPKSTESGFYEAQLVYPDGRESLKYWNKIEIR